MAYVVCKGYGEFVLFTELQASCAEEALCELVKTAEGADRLGDTSADKLVEALVHDDRAQVDFAGAGVACVHLPHPSTTLLVGRSKVDLNFKASDGRPARVVILVLGGEDYGPGPAELLPRLCLEGFCAQVMQVQDPQDIVPALDARRRAHAFGNALQRSRLLIELQTTTMEGAMRELVEGMAGAGLFKQERVDRFVERLIHRERQGSTGFGKGIAVPRIRTPGLTEILVVVGRSRRGVEFNALDRRPVDILVPILVPEGAYPYQIPVEESICRCLMREEFREGVRAAGDISDVLGAIDEVRRSD